MVTESSPSNAFEFSAAGGIVKVEHTTAVTAYAASNVTEFTLAAETSTLRTATQVLLTVIGFAGIVANGLVVCALLATKEFCKNTTNVFICNQTVIDIVACIALATTSIIQKIGTPSHAVGFSRHIICWFFDNTSFLGASVCASKFSLVVITLERYFKVVHAAKHQNNLRSWMVKLGVVAPWIDGLFLVIFPLGLTSNVVEGVCQIGIQKPEAGKLYCMFLFFWHFLLPLLIFVFCYSKILSVVRRQNHIAPEMNQPKNIIAGPSGDRTLQGLQIFVVANERSSIGRRQGGSRSDEDQGNQQISHAEKKVIRTMLTVTVCFIICWFPIDFFQAVYWFIPYMSVSVAGTLAMTFLAYVNVLLNAVIYCSHLSVLTCSRRAFRKLCDVGCPPVLRAVTMTRNTQPTRSIWF